MNTSIIQKKVMRRVYYSYIVSVMEHPMMWRGVFLGSAGILLADWLNVASIVNNFLSVPVGHVPIYVYGAFYNAIIGGEFVTALTILLAGGVAISAGYRIINEMAPKLMILPRT